MEELGIGRPSTYAPTITTIISRRYVSKEQRNLYVTELGEVVNSIMKQAFPKHCGREFHGYHGGTSGLCGEWYCTVEDSSPELLSGSET